MLNRIGNSEKVWVGAAAVAGKRWRSISRKEERENVKGREGAVITISTAAVAIIFLRSFILHPPSANRARGNRGIARAGDPLRKITKADWLFAPLGADCR